MTYHILKYKKAERKLQKTRIDADSLVDFQLVE